MKKRFLCAAMMVAVVFGATGCTEDVQRSVKTAKSNLTGGLERKITAYD